MPRARAKIDPEFLLMLCFILFCGVFLYQLRSLNATAALFPNVVTSILLLLLVYHVAGRLIARKADQSAAAKPDKASRAARPGTLTWYHSLAAMAVYFLLIFVLGFSLATAAYALSLPFLLGHRHKTVNILFALGITLVMVIAFGRIFYITFPETILSGLLN